MDEIAVSFSSNSLLGLKTRTGRCWIEKSARSRLCVELRKSEFAYLENDQFQFCDIIRVDPVFRGLADKVLLRPSGGGISLDWVSLGPDQIVKLGKFYNEGIIIIFEEGLSVKACGEDGSQVPAGLFLAKLAHGQQLG